MNLEVLCITFFIGLCIGIINFSVKSSNFKINSNSTIINRYSLIGLIMAFYFGYCICFKKQNLLNDIKITKYELLAAVIFTICAGLSESYLYTKYQVTDIAPIIIAWALIFIALIGKYFFNEKFTKIHCLGYGLIILGLLVLLKK